MSFAWIASGLSWGLILVMAGALSTFVLRPMPGVDIERIVRIGGLTTSHHADPVAFWNASGMFESLAEYRTGTAEVELASGGDRVPQTAAVVSAGFFSVFGVTPLCGSLREVDSGYEAAPGQVIVSTELLGLGGKCAGGEIGRQIRIQGISYTVRGVVAGGFNFPQGARLWLPLDRTLTFQQQYEVLPGEGELHGWVGRLGPGYTLAAAHKELMARLTYLNEREVKRSSRVRYGDIIIVNPLLDILVSDRKTQVILLVIGAAVLGLVALLNLAALAYLGVTARRTDLAVRVSLGATLRHLFVILARDVLMWFLPGIGIGLLIAEPCWNWIAPQMVSPLLALPAFPTGIVAAGFVGAIVLMAAAAAAVGLILAKYQKIDTGLLSDHAVRHTSVRPRLRTWIVTGQVAFTMVLLVFATVAYQSLIRAAERPLGFTIDGVLFFHGHRSRAAEEAEYKLRRMLALQQELRGGRGNIDLAVSTSLPLAGSGAYQFARGPNRPEPFNIVASTGNYFSVLGIRLLAGRTFEETDRRVAILDVEGLARLGFSSAAPGEAIGKAVRLDGEDFPRTIIGVVSSVLDHPPPFNQRMYLPVRWPYQEKTARHFLAALRCGANCASQLESALPAIQSVIGRTPPKALRSVLDEELAPAQRRLGVLGLYSGAAFLLALAGVYGLSAQIVLYRRYECALRMALGASFRHIAALLLAPATRSTAAGIVFGAICVLGLLQFAQSQIHGLAEVDWSTIAYATGGMLIAGLASCAVPVYRACRDTTPARWFK
jgi:hypothetical protein